MDLLLRGAEGGQGKQRGGRGKGKERGGKGTGAFKGTSRAERMRHRNPGGGKIRKLVRPGAKFKFGQLILRKIIKAVTTSRNKGAYF